MTLLRRKSILAAKVETTAGTAESLANADAAFNAYDMVITPNIEVAERLKQGGFDRLAGVPGARQATATFRTEAWLGATVPNWAAVLFPACGWVDASSTFSASTAAPGASVKTLTIAHYVDGKRFLIYGAMGTFVMNCPNGRLCDIEWTFTGKWGTESDLSLLTPTYPTDPVVRYASATTVYNSASLCCESVRIDAGNTVVMRECATDATGFHSAIITDRYSKITVNPESKLVATRNPHGQLTAGTEATFQIDLATSTGTLSIATAKAQVLSVTNGDRNGLLVDEIEFGCNIPLDFAFDVA